jgi:hypothetical protein
MPTEVIDIPAVVDVVTDRGGINGGVHGRPTVVDGHFGVGEGGRADDGGGAGRNILARTRAPDADVVEGAGIIHTDEHVEPAIRVAIDAHEGRGAETGGSLFLRQTHAKGELAVRE